ncbi:Aste57867_20597 [Aphanomyces stellatus]|uniref:alpha-1,2-Mannosidase n=1 Tax=Aphanomyces stellatus TaxID=120398 RepID=A0A485LFF1_9STRA|nr:hypothetical protein As57867_020530 [Aphanomyces stellatus]VFT97277.1 Aste57867_20597 [Aphanomyces stellatus]
MMHDANNAHRWLLVAISVWCATFLLVLDSRTSLNGGRVRSNLLRASDHGHPHVMGLVLPNAAAMEQAILAPSFAQAVDEATSTPRLETDTAMRESVVSAMQWAWKGYHTFAFGFDSLDVNTNGHVFDSPDLAVSLVDSLDTLYLMGLMDEFHEAAAWAETNMLAKHAASGSVSLFETTIRVLGGYLSAHQLSGRAGLLRLADDLGGRLAKAFNHTPFPLARINLASGATSQGSCLAEFTTIQLEFKYLARLTGKPGYANAVDAIMDKVAWNVQTRYPDGLLPVSADNYGGTFPPGRITIGACGDSYYEYLLKQWLYSGKRETKYRDMYEQAVTSIAQKLVGHTAKSNWVFLGELESSGGSLNTKMDHLVCFVPGMLALGYINGMPSWHLDLAKDLLHTCFEMYNQMDSKLAPERAYFNTASKDTPDLQTYQNDAFNILRPETVESLMLLYRVTGDRIYREWGKVIFDAFEEHCKMDQGGYSSVNHVDTTTPTKGFRPEMESFFMAETLKYFYLLYSDETVVPLDQFIFNTEAHPFPIEAPDIATSA